MSAVAPIVTDSKENVVTSVIFRWPQVRGQRRLIWFASARRSCARHRAAAARKALRNQYRCLL